MLVMRVDPSGRDCHLRGLVEAGPHGYGCEIIAENVDFGSRPKSAENENPELVDRDDEIPF
jgi:single-strand DNA-binding protein